MMNILLSLIRKYRPFSSAIFCIASITILFPLISQAQLSPENRNEHLISNNPTIRESDRESELPAAASANGKYSNLLQVLNCPSDRSKYGEFDDYGSWSGSSWCGQDAQAGYWVWVYPNWYIWQKQK